jgi:hypothetical protein
LRGRERDEQPDIAELITVALFYVALLFRDEIPLFV